MSKSYPKDVLEKLANRLNGAFSYPDTLTLTSSLMLTVKYHKTRYKKLPFIGGERFNMGNIWVGKSGQLVFCFRPGYATDEFQVMEVTQDKLIAVFPDLHKALTTFLGASIEDYLDAYSEVASEKEQAETEKVRQDNYGPDWGQFG